MSSTLRNYTDKELDHATFWTGCALHINPDQPLDETERASTQDIDAILAKGMMTRLHYDLRRCLPNEPYRPSEFKPWSSLTPGDFIEWARTMRWRLSSHCDYKVNPFKGSHLASVDDYPPIRRHVYDWVVKREAEAEQALAKRAKL